ncbi:unnamed protein product [Lathyrus oleraceus]
MESWSYIPEERSYLFSDEMEFSLDAFTRRRKPSVELENKSSCNFERDGFKSMEFVDLGFPDFFQKSFHGSKPMESSGVVHGSVQTSSCELDSNNSSKRGNSSIHVIAFDSSFREEDYESKHLSSLFESKNHDSSLSTFLNQGASNDRDAKVFVSTPIHQAVLSKRARTSTLLPRLLYAKFMIVIWILAPQKIITNGIKFAMFTPRQLKLLSMALNRGFVSSATGSIW